MKLRILAATTVASIVAATVLAAPAEAAAFGVTLKTSSAKADVDTPFTLSGKVTGTGAGSKKITVQRKVLTDASPVWKNFSTITTRPTRTYSKTFTALSAGAKQYRVLVPKTSKLTTGTSNAVTVTGYTWLDLYDQRYLSQGGILTRGYYGELNGRTPPAHSFTLAGGDTRIYWNLGGLCDSVHASVEVPDNGGPRSENFTVDRAGEPDFFTLHEGEARSLDWDATGGYSFSVAHTNGSTSGNYVALLAPTAHCSASRLPIAID